MHLAFIKAPKFCSVGEYHALRNPRFSRLSFLRQRLLYWLQTKNLTEDIIRGNFCMFAANSDCFEYIEVDFNGLHAYPPIY